MAKLSARGRTEVLRLQRFDNESIASIEQSLDETGTIKPLIRREIVLMSDGMTQAGSSLVNSKPE